MFSSRRLPKLAQGARSNRARFLSTALVLLVSFLTSLHTSTPVNGADAPAAATAPAPSPPSAKPVPTSADIPALLAKLTDETAGVRKEVLEQLARTGDARLEAVFTDFSEGSLYLWKGQAVSCKKFEEEAGGKFAPLIDPLTR